MYGLALPVLGLLCLILYLLSRYMRPDGPWRRQWAFCISIFPQAADGRAVIVGSSNHQKRRASGRGLHPLGQTAVGREGSGCSAGVSVHDEGRVHRSRQYPSRGQGEDSEGEEGGQHPPRMFISFVFPSSFLCCSFFQVRNSFLGRRGVVLLFFFCFFSCFFFTGGWGPDYDWLGSSGDGEKRSIKQLLPLPWPFGLHVAGE